MSKHKILFASSLKPAFDTRTEKLFLSFINKKKYECHFCGVKSTGHKNIHSWKYNRGLLFRLWINLRFFYLLILIKPQTIIINNTDLAHLSIIYQSFNKTQLIFDIQENQINNIIYQQVYTGLKKSLLLLLTNLTNSSLKKHCSGFILAEKCYKEELTFIKNKPFLILENKAHPCLKPRRNQQTSVPLQLLFSGTISLTSGVLNATNWLKEINNIVPCSLTIIGHSPNKQLHKQLTTDAATDQNITYLGSLSPIPHFEIEKEIAKADFGLICYELTTANKNKTPTKLYEYLAAHLPIICQDHTLWNDLISINQAGLNYSELIKTKQVSRDFHNNQSTNFAQWNEQLLTKWFDEILIK